jgi:hypothetical protein
MLKLKITTIGAAALVLALGTAAQAEDYSAGQLLAPCMEADNDARWGETAELECEQYILGYVGALKLTGGVGDASGICLPEENLADEVRWAYMRWINEKYSRRSMPAADALMGTLKEKFACGAK